MSRPRRHVAWIGVALLALTVTGCQSDAASRFEEKARKCKRDALGARLTASLVAAELAEEATRLQEARAAEKEPRVEASMRRLKDGQVVLEAIEDAERTFSLATRFYEVHDALELPEKLVQRLDADVARMVEVALGIVARRVPDFTRASVEGTDPARSAKAMLDLQRVTREIERDRAAIKAYRMDIAIATQLGPER